MKIKNSKTALYIIFLISIFSISSCEELDDLNDSIDETVGEAVNEMLGISALSEDLNKTSSNYSLISDIVINNKLITSSETKMTLPSSVSISYTQKRYTLSGSAWNISTTKYTGTISRDKFNKTSNVVKIVVQNNTPTVSVNNVVVSTSSSGGTGGTGGSGGTGTTGPTILTEGDISGKIYELKVASFTVPTGIKTMVIKTTEPTNSYRNMADLFVRKGSAPIVSGPPKSKYTWTADYNSINPNRESEVCTISNPSSGTWYVGLYGYNDAFSSRLTVTITK